MMEIPSNGIFPLPLLAAPLLGLPNPLMPRSIAKKSNLNRTFIREWRKKKGINLDRLASRVPMAVSSLSRVERGEQPYSQPMLEAIAEALGCEPADLLTRDPSQEPPSQQILDLYAQLDDDERSMARGYMEGLVARKVA